MQPNPLEKQPSGIPGLDNVLKGGFPKGRISVLRGGHGTGKTVIALNFLYTNALEGVPGLFVSFEEDVASIRRNAASMGWDLEKLEAENKLALVSFDVGADMILSGDFDISATIAIIQKKAESIGAQLCVIDAFDWLLSLFSSQDERRKHLLRLHRSWGDHKYTTLFTVKDEREEAGFLNYLCDCVLALNYRAETQIAIRRLRVTKYRGSDYLSNELLFIIGESGPRMLPVSGVSLRHKPITHRVSAGDPSLDLLLGGGLFNGGCALVAGASGTGKTTLLSTFTEAACERGERVLYVSFEESADSLVFTMKSPGIELQPHIDQGNLKIISSFPEAKGADQQLIEVLDLIHSYKPDHLCIDAISTARRMGDANAAFDFQIRLFYACKEAGVTCINSIQAKDFQVAREMGRLELSSIAETVIGLEQHTASGTYGRSVNIIKSRGTAHSNGSSTFIISSKGMVFEEANTYPPTSKT